MKIPKKILLAILTGILGAYASNSAIADIPAGTSVTTGSGGHTMVTSTVTTLNTDGTRTTVTTTTDTNTGQSTKSVETKSTAPPGANENS